MNEGTSSSLEAREQELRSTLLRKRAHSGDGLPEDAASGGADKDGLGDGSNGDAEPKPTTNGSGAGAKESEDESSLGDESKSEATLHSIPKRRRYTQRTHGYT